MPKRRKGENLLFNQLHWTQLPSVYPTKEVTGFFDKLFTVFIL